MNLRIRERSFDRGFESRNSVTCVVAIVQMPEDRLLVRSVLTLETRHTVASAPRLHAVVRRTFAAALSRFRRASP